MKIRLDRASFLVYNLGVFANANSENKAEEFAIANRDAMNYLTVKEAAQKWGVTPRRVQRLCADNRIVGAVRFGRSIMIPENAEYPVKSGVNATDGADSDYPRKTPFLQMTDLYNEAGGAERGIEQLAAGSEAQRIFSAEIAYLRGDISTVYGEANYFLERRSSFYSILSSGMLLALCAIWHGDLEMWRRAKLHIAEAPAKNDIDRDIILLSLTAVDSMLYDVANFPEWFKIGNFEVLPKDTLPAVKVYYAKYLYASGYAVATKQIEVEGVSGTSLLTMIPFTLEPMISQAKADNSIISEIYLRMTCAAAYHNSGNDAQAIRHIDKALALALPDKLYGLLAEYCRALDSLVETRLSIIDAAAWKKVKELYVIYNKGWSTLSGQVRGRQIITTLSPRVREVAKLAAFGMSNAQIAEKLNMSIASVKQAIKITSEKSGMDRRNFAAIL